MALFGKNPNEVAYTGGKKHWADVIKNTGPGELLIWRQPEEDFNTNSTVVCVMLLLAASAHSTVSYTLFVKRIARKLGGERKHRFRSVIRYGALELMQECEALIK